MSGIKFSKDEKVDFFEFVTAVVDHSRVFREESIKKAFHLLATENTNTINQENFMIILPRENEKKSNKQMEYENTLWKELMMKYDKDGDNKLNLEEFTFLIKDFLNNN